MLGCERTFVQKISDQPTALEFGTAASEPGPSLEIRVIPGSAITPALAQAWRDLQQSNAELQSPFFAPEFTQAVAAVRSDVEVALVAQGGAIRAIFPFQRQASSRAIPVGGILSDYQGLICSPGFAPDPRLILKACGLVAWDFDRLLARQQIFAPFHKLCKPSALIDLSAGYDTYAADRRANGSQQIRKCENMIRRMEREIGPVRFVSHSGGNRELARVLAWKSQQYRKSGWHDMFAGGWGRELVERIHATQTRDFGGMLSLLSTGSRLVAGHLGMRCGRVWHYWFPAYNRQFAKYSPGLVLLLKMAAQAEALGFDTIDLGTGLSLYKRRLMNASVPVAEGSVERPSWLSLRRNTRRRLKSLAQKLPILQPMLRSIKR